MTTITSPLIPLNEDNVDTDAIFPARFLVLAEKTGLGQYLFRDRKIRADTSPDPDFVLNKPELKNAKILLAGRNFGSGSSREQAAWALADFGIRCVIATSFGEIFYANCFRNGILPIKLGEGELGRLRGFAEAKAPVTVDLIESTIKLDTFAIAFSIDDHQRRGLIEGLDDIEAVMAEDLTDIERFETKQRNDSAWIMVERLGADWIVE